METFYKTMKQFFEVLQNELDDHGDVENFCIRYDEEICDGLVNVNNLKNVLRILESCSQNYAMEYTILESSDTFIKLSISYNACVSCKTNLGLNNPRQYCKKYFCPFENTQ